MAVDPRALAELQTALASPGAPTRADGAARVPAGLQLAVLSAALAAILALTLFPLSPGYFAGAGLLRHYFFFALAVSICSAAIHQAPARHTERLQLFGLLLTAGLSRALIAGAAAPLLLAASCALALALSALPLEKKWVRLLAIGALTASFPLLRVWPALVLPLMGMLQQALLCADHFRDPARRSPARCLRALSLPQWQPTPIPIEDLERSDLGMRNFLGGALWLILGPALYQVCSRYIEKVGLPDPVGELLTGHPLLASAHALFYAAFALLFVFSILVVDGATGRLLGLPVRSPMQAPWKATNFMDYWRRANTWVHFLMSSVYFRNLFPPRGWRFPFGVFTIFLITAWLKSATHPGFDPGSYARWAGEGALVAATAWWLQRRSRARVQGFVASGRPLRRRFLPGALAAALLVFLAHGLVVEFSWHFNNDPVGAVQRALIGR